MNLRVLWHIGFWLLYTLAYALIDMSFSRYPSGDGYSLTEQFFIVWSVEISMLPAKLIAAYTFLYYLVPRHFRPSNYLRFGLLCLLLLLPLMVFNRVIVYYFVYPVIYDYPTQADQFLNLRRMLFYVLDIASAVGVASTVKLLKGRLESQLREEELQREKLQSELNFLRAQTNPHFLFNTLNNIYALARKQSPNTAPVVMKLSQILRFMLYECTQPRIPLGNELKVIRDYIELEKLRYNKRLSISFQESIDEPHRPVAPLLLLPFVENAFKHGSSETRFDTYINIDLRLQAGQLGLTVANSKDSDPVAPPSNGIGLQNVRRQLELLYPGQHQLAIQNEAQRFTVQLNIDLNRDL